MGGHPHELTIDRPRVEVIPIIVKLLEDKALEEGEEYEYIPIEELVAKGQHNFLPIGRGRNLLSLSWQSKLSPSRLQS